MASKRLATSFLNPTTQALGVRTTLRCLSSTTRFTPTSTVPTSKATHTSNRSLHGLKYQSIHKRWESNAASSGTGAAEDKSTIPKPTKTYGFDEIQDLISAPSPDRILIDAREPHELVQTGRIPTSINVPVSSSADAFFMTPEAFEDKFGFAQPDKDVEVVFYCRSGVRSRAAAELASRAGWGRVGEYQGSWLDWEGKGGSVEK